MANPLKIVFLGTSSFAVPCLKALVNDPKFTVELVITQPDRPVGRKQTLTPPPVKIAAEELGLPIFQPENINKEFHNCPLSIVHCPFLIVISYGQILSQEILDLPSVAAVNVHASLLPKYRGASPIQHALLSGERETGVTVQKMVKELDAGPILSQKRILIGEHESFVSLHEKLATLGAELLLETLASPLKESEQNASEATFCKKLTREDGKADPKTMTAETIDRMVRALSPWPGVSIDESKILETTLVPEKEALEIPCAEGTKLFVTKIQPKNGKPMSGQAFARGRKTH